MNGHDRLTPAGKRFYAEIKKLTQHEVFIGYQAGKKIHKTKTKKKVIEVDMAQVAAINEFGTSTTPARPFLRKTVDENQDLIVEMCNKAAHNLAQGSTEEKELKTLGAFGVERVQEKIRSGSYVPNSPSTIKRKKSSKPLIATGQMRQSVHYVIKGKED